jgi:hypothetical protein
MEVPRVDTTELVEQITAKSMSPEWFPLPPAEELENFRQSPVRSEESLDYLHRNSLPHSPDSQEAGGGIKGRIIRRFGRLTFRVLGPYLREERELLANLVMTNDALARRCDELAKVVADRQVAEAENGAKLAVVLQKQSLVHGAHSEGRSSIA